MRGDDIGGPIRWRMHLPVPPERVYEALDTDAGRASFWAESAVEREDAVEFRFINGYSCCCRILERVPPRLWAIDYMGGIARFEKLRSGARYARPRQERSLALLGMTMRGEARVAGSPVAPTAKAGVDTLMTMLGTAPANDETALVLHLGTRRGRV